VSSKKTRARADGIEHMVVGHHRATDELAMIRQLGLSLDRQYALRSAESVSVIALTLP
jgi:hypothetical protein